MNATWTVKEPSNAGLRRDCKSAYSGSIPDEASKNQEHKQLRRLDELTSCLSLVKRSVAGVDVGLVPAMTMNEAP